MYAVVIFPYTKSIRVIPVKWVLNFDKKNIEKINQIRISYIITIRIWKKTKF
jgi:hypothetical protein